MLTEEDGTQIVFDINMEVKKKRGRPFDPWSEYWDVMRLYRVLRKRDYSKDVALDLTSRVTGKNEDNIRKFEARFRPKRDSSSNTIAGDSDGQDGKDSERYITPLDDKTDLQMLRAVYDKYGWRENAEKEGIADAIDFLNKYHKYQK